MPGAMNHSVKAEVWTGHLDRPPAQAELLRAVLSGEELRRAARLRAEHARTSFILSRAYLRGVLAQYLRVPPARIPLAAGPSGKPLVLGSELRFNISHSGGLFVCIVATGEEVGIDIERVRSVPDMARMARRFFAPAELESWNRMPDAQRQLAFFRCWTRKEAFLKATGDGLKRALDSFAVSLEVCAGNCLIAPPEDVARWHVQSFAPAEGFVGAIATAGEPLAITRRRRVGARFKF
jgi:4'-phosphopantetheinyl transferase